MANELYIYTTPKESAVTLTLDSGQTITGVATTANGRSDAHLCQLPAATPGQGGMLKVSVNGYHGIEHRGIVVPSETGEAKFQLDDVHLVKVAPPPPPLLRNPNLDPFALISSVFQQGSFDLSTKLGCGLYTEAACKALNEQHSQWWGHIRKIPPQNQHNGHAVDAIMLVSKTGTTRAGIYDIILGTESPTAKPAFTRQGDPNFDLWYYPA